MIAQDPGHLESDRAPYSQAIVPGRLELNTEKLIAYLVSVMINCGVWVRLNLDAVKHLGVDDASLTMAAEGMARAAKGNLIMLSKGGRHYPWEANTANYPPLILLSQQHPPGDEPVCLPNLNFQGPAIGLQAAEDSPEIRGVVQLSDMAELVQEHVPNKVLW